MGRRCLNTTKSGKYLNPTDQARKEARKKELKKNKTQRQIVRTAVLRGKDPMELLSKMEKIDQMEYNVLQPSPLNEKVLKGKRKKLRDVFDRVMKMHHKDDPEKWSEIRRCETEYEKCRNHLLQYYEAVKHTQEVSIDDIPLPMSQNSENKGNYNMIPLSNEYGMMPLSAFGDDASSEEQYHPTKVTIEAKAQMRNLIADVTRFLPMSVRIKRDDAKLKDGSFEIHAQ